MILEILESTNESPFKYLKMTHSKVNSDSNIFRYISVDTYNSEIHVYFSVHIFTLVKFVYKIAFVLTL